MLNFQWIFKAYGNRATRRSNKSVCIGRGIERLETRTVLTAPVFPVQVVQSTLANGDVHAGDTNVVFGGININGKRGVNPQRLTYDAIPGASLNVVDDWKLELDRYLPNGRPGHDGIYETTISGNVINGHLRFNLGKVGPLVVSNHIPGRITGDVRPDVVGGTLLGLDDVFVQFANRPRTNPTYTGHNPIYTVTTEPQADLAVTLSGPAQVEAGNGVSYVINVRNNGPVIATGVTVAVHTNGQDALINVGTLQAGMSQLGYVTFTSPEIGAAMTTMATVSSSTVDPNGTNNQSSVTTNLTHTNVLNLTFDGNDAFIQPDQLGVNFGGIDVSTTNGSVVAEDLFFSIYATDAGGENLGLEMSSFLSNLRLQESTTGYQVPLDLAFSDSSVGVYQLPNLVLENGSHWNLLGDMVEEYPGFLWSGDVFTASMILSPEPVDIPGVGVTGDYAPYFTDTDLRQVVEVHPSGILFGPRQTIGLSTMTFTALANGITETAVENQKDLRLASFDLSASGAELNSISFASLTGSLSNLLNPGLWVDTNNDNFADFKVSNGTISGNVLTFGVNQLIPGDHSRFEVRADVVSSLTADRNIQLSLVNGSIEATETNTGMTLADSQIVINTSVQWKQYSLVEQGDLFVVNGVQPRPYQILAGARGEEVFRFELAAQYETSDVNKIHFLVTGNGANDIDRLELYKLGSTVAFATATVASTGSDVVPAGGLTFTAVMLNQQLLVAEGTTELVIVKPRMKGDDQGAVSGHQFQVTIDPSSVVNDTTGEGAVHARGLVSSNALRGNNGNNRPDGEIFIGTYSATVNVGMAGPVETVVLSKVVNVMNNSPEPDMSNVPTGIAPIGEWKLTAASNTNFQNGLNKVIPDTLIIDVDFTNVLLDPTKYRLYNKVDPFNGVLASSVVTTPTGMRLTFTGLRNSSMDTRIASGQELNLVLQGMITNSKVTSSVSHLMATLHTDDAISFDSDAGSSVSVTGFDVPDSRIRSVHFVS